MQNYIARIIGVLVACFCLVAPACAETLILNQEEIENINLYVDHKCGSGGTYLVFHCDCGSSSLGITAPECVEGMTLGESGCIFRDNYSEGGEFYCRKGNSREPCSASGCNCASSVDLTDWEPSSGNMVVKEVQTVGAQSDSACGLVGDTVLKYGCKAGAYRTSGSGVSLQCSLCADGGTSAEGNTGTQAGVCYKPSGSKFAETIGSGVYVRDCPY